MHPATLPRSALQNLLDGALEPPVGVTGHQSHPREAAGDHRAQESTPERSVLAGAHVQAQHLPLAGLSLHADGYDHRHGDHATVLAGFDVGGVDPDVGVSSLQRPTSEALDLLVKLLAKRADPTLGDAAHAEGLHQLVDLA